MREIVIISGKGGTGKTTVIGSFAALAQQVVLADADVDAPNLHLLLSPETVEERPFSGAGVAKIAEDLCIECGRCEKVCQFAAIHDFRIDPRRCEGCAACTLVCPVDAITMEDQNTGTIFLSETKFGPLIHARLHAGGEATGRLVTEVRRIAQETAKQHDSPLLLTDGSPGIGCPVIASLTGAQAAVAVAEPTPSGLHDLRRVIEVASYLRVPVGVCINKWDINEEVAGQIEREAEGMGAKVLGRIPFDSAVDEAMAEGVPLVSRDRGPAAEAISSLWRRLAEWQEGD